MPAKFKVVESDLDSKPSLETLHLYRSLVGTIMFCAVWTRPDIAYSVNVLALFMNNPSPKLIKAAKQLYAYCDASDADDSFKRRSTGGYVCYFNGSPVSWSTGLQQLTTLSTCESEYVQAALTAKEVLYLQELLHYAGHKQITVTHIFEDNEAVMKLSENPINRGMSKHIGRRFHFLHQCAEDGHVALVPISSERNVADAFTKPLGSQLFERHQNSLGVSSVDRGNQGLL
eukprot:709697-Rhodomonas_salina.1